MLQLHGMKVISLTAGGLTDMRSLFFSQSMANNCREKSADAILDTDTSLYVIESTLKQEALPSVEGQNFIKASIKRLPNGGKKAEHIAR